MNLRPELMPPELDESLIERLAQLASRIDGAGPGAADDELEEFNRLAGTAIPFQKFQGIYGAEEHEDYVRRVLYGKHLRPDDSITKDEFIEIINRIMAGVDMDFNVELFEINCKHSGGCDLIFWPDQVAELPQDREPTAEEIAELAMGGS